MSKTIVFPSGETSSEIHVASSVVKRSVRTGLIGSAIAVALEAALGCCALGCCAWPNVGSRSDAPSVRTAAKAVEKRDSMLWGRKGRGQQVCASPAPVLLDWQRRGEYRLRRHSHIRQVFPLPFTNRAVALERAALILDAEPCAPRASPERVGCHPARVP